MVGTCIRKKYRELKGDCQEKEKSPFEPLGTDGLATIWDSIAPLLFLVPSVQSFPKFTEKSIAEHDGIREADEGDAERQTKHTS